MWQKIKNVYHLLVAILANIIFFFPARSIKVIGVTGTDGKTTTASMVYHILTKSGRKTSLLGSIEAKIGEKAYDTELHRTTPSSTALQRFLRKAVGSGSKFFVLEVTSHAIDQHRIWGIPFEAAVLTNVTDEHLDYHKTYENYLKTKTKLLKMAKYAITNADDVSYTSLKNLKEIKKDGFYTYALTNDADFSLKSFLASDTAREKFNKYNYLAAAAVCSILGLPSKEIEDGMKTFKLPLGRMEEVYDKSFRIVIDFAHTPNAFDSALSSLRPRVEGRLIHVFGSAGDRDKNKRPLMGAASSKYSDVIILTAEDPRKESVDQINSEIEQGIVKSKATVIKIPDRQEAITAAIQMAGKGDLVLLTGKAHEKSMNQGRAEEPWNEFEAVKIALSKTS